MHRCWFLVIWLLTGIAPQESPGKIVDTGDVSLKSSANYTDQQTRVRRSVHEPYHDCFKHFFIRDRPPSGFRQDLTNIRYICQQIPSNAINFYATMFDVADGIALYSAYYITPQMVNNYPPAYQRQGAWRGEPGIPRQGTDGIYANQLVPPAQQLQKGHLVPVDIYSFHDDYMTSTFKYTNAVPQYRGFNQGQWMQYEQRIKHYATATCSQPPRNGILYLITGTSQARLANQGGPANQAGVNRFPNNPNNNIVVPNSMWTAGCCEAQNGVVQSFAVIGNNDPNNAQIFMSQVSVAQLQVMLLTGVNGIGGPAIHLFPGQPACENAVNSAPALQNPPQG